MFDLRGQTDDYPEGPRAAVPGCRVVQEGAGRRGPAWGGACGGAVPGWCKELGTEGEAGGWNGSCGMIGIHIALHSAPASHKGDAALSALAARDAGELARRTPTLLGRCARHAPRPPRSASFGGSQHAFVLLLGLLGRRDDGGCNMTEEPPSSSHSSALARSRAPTVINRRTHSWGRPIARRGGRRLFWRVAPSRLRALPSA